MRKKNYNPMPSENSEFTPEAVSSACPVEPLDDQIRQRAYELFEERGRQPGREFEDWLQAEREDQAPLKLFGIIALLKTKNMKNENGKTTLPPKMYETENDIAPKPRHASN